MKTLLKLSYLTLAFICAILSAHIAPMPYRAAQSNIFTLSTTARQLPNTLSPPLAAKNSKIPTLSTTARQLPNTLSSPLAAKDSKISTLSTTARQLPNTLSSPLAAKDSKISTLSTTGDTDQRKTYALILNPTTLYRTNSGEQTAIENQYFALPTTYFVEVLAQADEQNLIHCLFMDIEGYVLASDVEIVTYIPRYIYPKNLTLRIDEDIAGLKLRPTPSRDQTEIATIPQSAGEISYYNYLDGENIDNRGTKWYFVKYNSVNGYLYAPYLVLTVEIAPNVIEPLPDPSEGEDETNLPVPKEYEYLFIALLCLPAVLIIYLLFRGNPNSYPRGNRPSRYGEDE